jgi:hypothetical protein
MRQRTAAVKVPSSTTPGPDMGLANARRARASAKRKLIASRALSPPLPMLRRPARLEAAFDVYQTGLLARTQVETRRIKEVSQ